MRSLAGCVGLALLLAAGPLVAQEASDKAPPAAAEAPVGAAPAPASATVAPNAGDSAQAPKDAAAAEPTPASTPEPAAAPAPPAPPPPPPITLVLNTDLAPSASPSSRTARPSTCGRSPRAAAASPRRPAPSARSGPRGCGIRASTSTRRCRTPSSSIAARLSMAPARSGCWAGRPRTAACAWRRAMPRSCSSWCTSTATPQTKVVVHSGSKGREPAVARRGSRGELASARPRARGDSREPRSARRSLAIGPTSCLFQADHMTVIQRGTTSDANGCAPSDGFRRRRCCVLVCRSTFRR